MENLLFLGVPILKHIRATQSGNSTEHVVKIKEIKKDAFIQTVLFFWQSYLKYVVNACIIMLCDIFQQSNTLMNYSAVINNT